jgi:hypothetical protein
MEAERSELYAERNALRDVLLSLAARLRVDSEEAIWMNDSIQFPRLINNFRAAHLSADQWRALGEAMDLGPKELAGLFARAEKKWEHIKAVIYDGTIPEGV